ncbi:MAG: ABC transporter permease [Sedimentisphaerales bacterium]|nr:ABC transporter permease [Sedimentisphaerales bacterium]
MTALLNDIKYTLRQLRKSPGFAIIVVLLLSLGIGINATAFSVVNAILFRSLPVKEPDRLFSMSIHTQEKSYNGTFSYPDLEFFRNNADVFDGVFTFQKMTLSLKRYHTRKIMAEWVSRDYFNILGIKSSMGRFFSLEEQSVPNTYPVAVLSHAFWKREYNSRENVLGTDIVLNNKNYTIVGVAEPGFEGIRPSQSPDLWLPMMMLGHVSSDALTRNTTYEVIGRLNSGTSRQQAETKLTARLPELDKNFPHFKGKRSQGRIILTPCGHGTLAIQERGSAWIGSLMFLSITGMILLIACANMANLLLARAMARRREIATRMALGAERIHLIRQLLCESLVLALAGGSIGIWLTHNAIKLFTFIRPAGVKLPYSIGLDTRVVVFTVFLSILTILIFGLIPALQSTRMAISQALKENPGILSRNKKRFGVRNILIAGQITFCVVLLMLAGLLLRNIQHIMNIDYGFDSRHTLLVQLPESLFAGKDVDPYSIHEQIVGRVETLPGVESASLVDQPQLSGGSVDTAISLPGAENHQQVKTYCVGPNYFKTMGISVKRGREFFLHDRKEQKKVVIINETLAHLLWPKGDSLGRIISNGDKQFEVCGIVANSKYHDAREIPQPAVYYCLLQTGMPQVLIVRSQGQPVALSRILEEKIHAMVPAMPRPQSKTYTRQIQEILIGERVASLFISIVGAGGLLLASVGLYGIVSYMGRLRTSEVGVRIALGAKKFDIIRLVVRQAFRIVMVGLMVGMFLAIPFALFLSKIMPFGFFVFDPMIFVIVTLVLLITAAFACYIPARRAARIDPMEALRYE